MVHAQSVVTKYLTENIMKYSDRDNSACCWPGSEGKTMVVRKEGGEREHATVFRTPCLGDDDLTCCC